MRPSSLLLGVLARWIGLLALLFLSVWLGAHLARADEKPRPRNQTEKTAKKDPPRRDDRDVPTTPPGFPFGPAGGSAMPAGAGNSGALNPLGFTLHP